MIVQLLPAIAARAQAGEKYASDERLFSMLFCVWWTLHNKLQKNTSAIDEEMMRLRVGCKKHVSSVSVCIFLRFALSAPTCDSELMLVLSSLDLPSGTDSISSRRCNSSPSQLQPQCLRQALAGFQFQSLAMFISGFK